MQTKRKVLWFGPGYKSDSSTYFFYACNGRTNKTIFFRSGYVDNSNRIMEKKVTAPRCSGQLSSGNACLRKRQHGELCSYHHKASQHIVLHLIEVNGILHFVDQDNAIYDSEAVVLQRPNPSLIGHCTKIGDTLVMI